jgi:hypothetical protein
LEIAHEQPDPTPPREPRHEPAPSDDQPPPTRPLTDTTPSGRRTPTSPWSCPSATKMGSSSSSSQQFVTAEPSRGGAPTRGSRRTPTTVVVHGEHHDRSRGIPLTVPGDL